MSPRPLVTIITPTRGREAFLPLAHACVQAQTYPNIQWVVFDDSPRPSPYLQPRAAKNLLYINAPDQFEVGEKRNLMIEHSHGEIIVHFDDDDYYAPHYVETLVNWLEEGADFVKLSGWYLYSRPLRRFGYWDTAAGGPHFRWSRSGATFVEANTPPDDGNRLGYGFTYAYRRSLWQSAGPFPTVNTMEDLAFARAAAAVGRIVTRPDQSGLALHILHDGSTSLCLPQQDLPLDRLDTLFGPAVQAYTGE